MDAKQSMMTPSAPALDPSGAQISPSCAVAYAAPGGPTVAQPSPLGGGAIGRMAPLQGIERGESGAVLPQAARAAADAAIASVSPSGPPTPGY